MEDGYYSVKEMGGKISPCGGRGPELSNERSRLPSVGRNQPSRRVQLACLEFRSRLIRLAEIGDRNARRD